MRHGKCIAIAAVFLGAFSIAWAQDWPAKPIRVVVPMTAGSVVDIVPRIIFEQLSVQLRQPIVVENRPGAGSTNATAFVARSEPDGYTMLINSSAYTITPFVYTHLPYDPVRDLAAIIPIGVIPNILVISPAKGIKTIHEFVDAAKAKHGVLTFATVGIGSATHMSAERFRISAGFEATHVPFKGAPEALMEVMVGRIDYCFCSEGTTLPFIRDGKLLALAVSTPKRSAILPDVPTTIEAGFANSDYTFWMGLFAPAKTPRDVIDKLHREIQKAMQVPTVREKLAKFGVQPLKMSPTEFDAYIAREIELTAPLVKAIGLKAN